MGIALSLALAAGIAPATAIAAETNSPVDAVVLQTAASSETAATEKDKAYAAMQEALKNLEAAQNALEYQLHPNTSHIHPYMYG